MQPIIKKIKQTEERFQQLFRYNHAVALIVDPSNSRIIEANNAAIDFYRYNLKELVSYSFDIFLPDQSQSTLLQLKQSLEFDGSTVTTKHRLQNGDICDVEVVSNPVEISNETLIYVVITDITEKLKTEKANVQLNKELEQARKMEALGQLTGGIAHDFNNMLGIIMGYTELSLEITSSRGDEKIPSFLKQVMTASNKAKDLIASMMLFSRTDDDSAQTVNISPLVKEDVKMLRSIIPTSIEIKTQIDQDLPDVSIEPVKLQQLIMNLCVNARDAMDGQGLLSINLSYQEQIHDSCLICYEKIKGSWVELSVTDTGSGMSKEVQQHLFEPFFTTKEKGKGTGMGMAVVHGIVLSLGGHILIDSKIDEGTSIRILFKPVEKDENIIDVTNDSEKLIKGNNEKILVIDDDKGLSNMTGDTLDLFGYQCTCFYSSQQALAAFTQSPNDFDLIFSDQTMPELTGLEMIKKMRKVRKDIPAIIATGYSESINESIAKENDILLFGKPLPKEDLLNAVSSSLKKSHL
jgi:PAS domain S-box-containing protein